MKPGGVLLAQARPTMIKRLPSYAGRDTYYSRRWKAIPHPCVGVS